MPNRSIPLRLLDLQVSQELAGPKSYLIELLDGRMVQQHADHMWNRATESVQRHWGGYYTLTQLL